MAQCLSCMRGFYNECRGGDCSGSEISSEPDTSRLHLIDSPRITERDEEKDDEDATKQKRFRRTKPDSALKDQQSTGRKRAARLYPLRREENCEWQGQLRKGGGDNPITGCVDGLQQARHHGPDKNTLNNDEGNVHRICHACHNRWHAKNDPDYDPNKPLKH